MPKVFYPCPEDLCELVERLAQTDEKLHVTFYPNDPGFASFAQNCHTLAYREVIDRVRQCNVHPYILQWGYDSFFDWGALPKCKIVSLYDKVGPESAARWKEHLLSVRPRDFPLEFLPLEGFFTDKKFVQLEFSNIPGKYIPYVQRLLPLLKEKYTLGELSVELHAYTDETYSDLFAYCGTMHTTSSGKLFFDASVPHSRQRQFTSAEAEGVG